MGKWINLDDLPSGRVEWDDIFDAPSIDLADYVPKDFHDKACEAMAKRHQEEIADMVSVVRCKECVFRNKKYLCQVIETDADDYCSYGERKATEITTDCSWK